MRLAMLVLFVGLVVPVTGWGANRCVTCHVSAAGGAGKIHGVEDWQHSAHARHDITCDRCHGGDPAGPTAGEAHRGILNSREVKSPLYFTRIPETCGGCHVAEFATFQKSYHYKELLRTGRGPNCVTCHGAMATRVMAPKEMEQTCVLCHARPTGAGEALVTLNLAGSLLTQWETRVRSTADGPGSASLKAAQQAYAQVQRKWHAFQMTAVRKEAEEIVRTARRELEMLRKQPMP